MLVHYCKKRESLGVNFTKILKLDPYQKCDYCSEEAPENLIYFLKFVKKTEPL